MSKIVHKTTGKISLFDQNFAKEKLSKIGNPLEKRYYNLSDEQAEYPIIDRS
jgi:hypothetical protein